MIRNWNLSCSSFNTYQQISKWIYENSPKVDDVQISTFGFQLNINNLVTFVRSRSESLQAAHINSLGWNSFVLSFAIIYCSWTTVYIRKRNKNQKHSTENRSNDRVFSSVALSSECEEVCRKCNIITLQAKRQYREHWKWWVTAHESKREMASMLQWRKMVYVYISLGARSPIIDFIALKWIECNVKYALEYLAAAPFYFFPLLLFILFHFDVAFIFTLRFCFFFFIRFFSILSMLCTRVRCTKALFGALGRRVMQMQT